MFRSDLRMTFEVTPLLSKPKLRANFHERERNVAELDRLNKVHRISKKRQRLADHSPDRGYASQRRSPSIGDPVIASWDWARDQERGFGDH